MSDHPVRRRATVTVVAAAMVGVLVGLAVGAGAAWAVWGRSGPSAVGTTALADVSAVVAQSLPAVVRVDVRGIGEDGASGNASGVLFDDAGHIVTNDHVVAGATSITVTFADNNTAPATLVGSDPSTDLAVIAVTTIDPDLVPIPLADQRGVAVGQPVLAMGSPYGLDGTVTSGIVSAVGRPVDLRGVDGQTVRLAGVIQTDARISPGNSGGPLIDLRGRLIGVSSSILGEESRGDIGFAIPADVVRDTASALIEDGRVPAPYLGVTTVDGQEAGVVVQSVTADSPADRAGVEVGDRITGVGDVIVADVADLIARIREQEVGATIDLHYVRDGAQATSSVRLSDGPP